MFRSLVSVIPVFAPSQCHASCCQQVSLRSDGCTETVDGAVVDAESIKMQHTVNQLLDTMGAGEIPEWHVNSMSEGAGAGVQKVEQPDKPLRAVSDVRTPTKRAVDGQGTPSPLTKRRAAQGEAQARARQVSLNDAQ